MKLVDFSLTYLFINFEAGIVVLKKINDENHISTSIRMFHKSLFKHITGLVNFKKSDSFKAETWIFWLYKSDVSYRHLLTKILM